MRITIRNYIHGEHLPWKREEIGYDPATFDPEWTWIVFVGDTMTAMLVGAKMLNSLMLVRLLSIGQPSMWLRTLWRHVAGVCLYRKIAGFWTCMDNDREPERKLLSLLQKDCSETDIHRATGLWVKGRF